MAEKNQTKSKQTNTKRLGRGLSSLMGQPVRVSASEPQGTIPEQPARAASTPETGAAVEETSAPVQAKVPASRAAGKANESGGPVAPSGLVVTEIEVGSIGPSPHQPRTRFNDEELEQLAASIKQSGLLQPILVRPGGEKGYLLIAGERRWRAAQRAGLGHIPAIVRDLDERTAAEWSLIENVQRSDLNSVERAYALKRLSDEFDLTQREIADRVGLERSSVANLIRLTELESSVLDMMSEGLLSAGHGKALLSVPAGKPREELAKRAADEGWSVRKLEQTASLDSGGGIKSQVSSGDTSKQSRSPEIADLERRLGEHLGTRVQITTRGDGKRGELRIAFFDFDHFDGLLSRMGYDAS